MRASQLDELCSLLQISVSWPLCKLMSPKRTLVWEQEMIFLWNGSCIGYIIDLYSLQGSHSFWNFRYGSPTNLIMRILGRNVLHSMQKGNWETYRASTTCRFCVRNISTYLRRETTRWGTDLTSLRRWTSLLLLLFFGYIFECTGRTRKN